MALQIAVLQGGVPLGTSAIAIYSAPAGVKAWIKRAVFTNVSGAAANLTVTVTRSGGPTLALIAPRLLDAGEAYVSPELASLALNSGDTVNALASTGGAIVAVMSGLVQ
jgi:hypothetical protein